MSRPTFIQINTTALLHNVERVKQLAPGKKIIAMVKANAYGSRLSLILNSLAEQVDAFGVACLEEAMQIRKLGIVSPCIIFQGVFNPEEYQAAVKDNFECIIHQRPQINWLINNKLDKKIKVWIKIDTGMHRLGFAPEEFQSAYNALKNCSWVDSDIGVMTHLACASDPSHPQNEIQLEKFKSINLPANITRSIANSAAIIALPKTHAEVVRPGIMLYGISPFSEQTGQELGLKPVINLISTISAIHDYPPGQPIGYDGIWITPEASKIGLVPIGYGDGYPRHIKENTPVWINGSMAPIVGRVSMDMLTVNLTNCNNVKIGDRVELWGEHLPIEKIAKCAQTIPYELICQLSMRVPAV